MKTGNTLKMTKVGRALLAGFVSMLTITGPAEAALGVDGNEWFLQDSGVTTSLISVSSVGNYAVATSNTGQLLEYRDHAWKAMDGWSTFLGTSPFGTAADRNQIKVTAVSETSLWVVSYASQGNFVRYNNGSFSTFASGTNLRSNAITSFGDNVLVGRGNGGIGVIGSASASSPFNRRQTLSQVAIVTAVSASGTSNMWATTGSNVWRSTNGGATTVVWNEQMLPSYITGGIRAIDNSSDTDAYFGATMGGRSYLYHWASGNFDEAPLYDFGADNAFSINGIYVRDVNNIWIAGTEGNLWFFDGTNATKIDLGISDNLNAISGTDSAIWVVGANGQIFSTLAAVPEPGSVALVGFAAAAIFGTAYYKKRHK